MRHASRMIFVILGVLLLLGAQVFAQEENAITTPSDTPVLFTLAAPAELTAPLTFTIDVPPANGTISGEPPSLLYTPNPGFTGTDSVTYTIVDAMGNVSSATFTLDVEEAAQFAPPPTSFSVDSQADVVVKMAEGSGYAIEVEPSNGTLSGQVPNLVYTPDSNMVGADSFTYSVEIDGERKSFTVDIDVSSEVAGDKPSPNLGAAARDVQIQKPARGLPGLSTELSQLAESGLNALSPEMQASIQTHMNANGLVEVTIRANDFANALAQVRNSGGVVLHEVGGTYIIAEVPVSSLAALGNVEGRMVNLPQAIPQPRPEFAPANGPQNAVGPNVGMGSSITQGVNFSNADAWQNAGYTGSGVKVGIIDIGYDNIDLAGEASCVVEVTDENGNPYSGTRGDHGSSVAEIVCDMAPNVTAYARDISTDTDIVNGLDYLINTRGVDIVTMSVGRINVPGDGSTVAALAIDDAMNNDGVFVSVSMGNNHDGHWEGYYYNDDSDRLHEWPVQGGGYGDINYFYALQGSAAVFSLVWNDWDGSVNEDFDLRLYRYDGSNWSLVTGSYAANTTFPTEFISYSIPSDAYYGLAIDAYSESPSIPSWLQLTNSNYSNPLLHEYEYASGGSPGTAQHSFSVAAVVHNTDALKDYSSRGPNNSTGGNEPYATGRTTHFQPQIAGPTEVSTSFGTFTGTSAAAPHAAGAAALVKDAYPNYNGFSLANYLRNSARTDPGPAGADAQYGYGFLYLGNPPVSNGGGTDTVGLYRDSARRWYLRNSNTNGFADLNFTYGDPTDIGIVGDWDGDGDDTIGIVRNGRWYLRNSNTNGFADLNFTYALSTDTPVVGDWNGDGVDTIGVRRGNAWYLRNSNSSGPPDMIFTFGMITDTPVVGDWNGDGVDTIGVVRGSRFYLRNTNSSGMPAYNFTFGLSTDTPVVGDWNGDGVDTIGMVRGNRWFLRNSNSNGWPDLDFTYGDPNDKPVVGDWDGN